MSNIVPEPVATVADARSSLSKILRDFRRAPSTATPVAIGSHRRPEAVIVPFEQFRMLAEGGTQHHESTLAKLRKRRTLIRRLAALSKVDDVAVFGSVARESDTESSDIDLLVSPSPDASMFDLAQFEIDMEELTGRAVDVVSRRSLDADRDHAILEHAVPL
ncbi:nucleotidyltransferase family protein [Salinibacterium hongtaonis]|uniref:Polymerase nucleotidyl transferase domain-containing protein n=1 Tax=Homoserinimonas hongtaonis TaxID=2079791 RepID=A0A2U1T016_9MICO|nr:nucleotidyltransferase domain-containing protein [Salinibacterium hongtaonis]AWB89671.1 hypothetical protein C2138_09050 [Salinibacterium hongtaonis]PWB97123.1 hypothetical protein DF220_04175 [Salinibacterium hongtaonis]